MSEIKAIETIYKLQKYRSRLEAKWAVFFDGIGLKFEYEPEGYVLSSGETYLPDFNLPDIDNSNMFAEVKPIGGDFTRAVQLAYDTKTNIVLLDGIPNLNPLLIYVPTYYYKLGEYKEELVPMDIVLQFLNLYKKYSTLWKGFAMNWNKHFDYFSPPFYDGYPLIGDQNIGIGPDKEYRFFVSIGDTSWVKDMEKNNPGYYLSVYEALNYKFGLKIKNIRK